MKKIIDLAVKRPVGAFMFFIALAVFGIIAAGSLPVEYLPDISIPRLIVTAPYPGLPAKETRELVTIPLEDSLSTLRGVSKIKSTTRDGLGIIELSFSWGTDMTIAAVEAREVIDSAYASLPSDAKKPMVLPVAPGEEAVLIIGVFPKTDDLTLARRLADREIKTRLQQVPGVGSITLIGGKEEEIKVDLDQAKMNSRKVTLDQIAQIIGSANVNYPAGSIIEGPFEYVIKTAGKTETTKQIKQFIISGENGVSFALGDISDNIYIGEREQASLFQLNGKEGIGLLVRRQKGKSPVTISKDLRAELKYIKQAYGKDLDFTVIQDSSITVKKSVLNVSLSALLGAAAAFFILLIFTRKISMSFIIILSIPFSIALALVLLMLSGISLNVMSLGGLALGIGMLVDNSVVVLDNLQQKCIGLKNDKQTIINTASEMASATLGSTLTSVVVFLPVVFLPGIIGALFKAMALAVIYALAASFLISITLVPMLYSLMKPTENKAFKRPWYVRLYCSLFSTMLRKPFIPLLFLIGTGIVTAILLPSIDVELFEEVDSGRIEVTVTLEPGSSMEWISEVGLELSRSVQRLDNVDSIAVYAGGENNDPYFLADPKNGKNIIHGIIKLKKSRSHSVFELITVLEDLIHLRNTEISISIPDELLTPLLGADAGKNIIHIYGDTPEEVNQTAEYMKHQIRYTDLYKYISQSPSGKKSQIHMVPDRQAIAASGYSLSDLSSFIRGSIFGNYASKLTVNGRDINIRVRLREIDRNTIEKLGSLKFLTQNGFPARLDDLLTISIKEESPLLLRQNRKDMAVISLSGPTRDNADKSVEQYITQFDNVVVESSSVFVKYAKELLFTFALALLLLYLILGAQFQSFILPFLLMVCLPFSFGGIIPALFISGHSINLNSVLGFLVLLGITINNSIILYETYKQKIERTKNITLSIYRGSASRIKPILMTMLTTVTALVPLAVDPGRTSTQSSMAVSIIGGLIVSTLLSIFIMPLVFHRYFTSRQNRINKALAKAALSASPAVGAE